MAGGQASAPWARAPASRPGSPAPRRRCRSSRPRTSTGRPLTALRAVPGGRPRCGPFSACPRGSRHNRKGGKDQIDLDALIATPRRAEPAPATDEVWQALEERLRPAPLYRRGAQRGGEGRTPPRAAPRRPRQPTRSGRRSKRASAPLPSTGSPSPCSRTRSSRRTRSAGRRRMAGGNN